MKNEIEDALYNLRNCASALKALNESMTIYQDVITVMTETLQGIANMKNPDRIKDVANITLTYVEGRAPELIALNKRMSQTVD